MAGNKISELTALSEITSGDLFIVTDDTSNASRRVAWSSIESSINIDNISGLDTVTLQSDSINQASFRIYQGDNSTDAPDIRLYKSRGTVASPSTVSATDALTRISAYAYEGAQYVQAGNIGFIASDGDGNGSFEVRTRVSDTLSPRISVNSSGETIIAGDLIQNPASSVTPASNGQLQVEATSNTVLTFKYKGSDGVVRSGTLALS